jgi:hypothetical protein
MRQPVIAVDDLRDRERVPERRAVLAVVEQLRAHRVTALERLAQPPHRGAVGARALKEPAVAADDLAGRVPGHPLEGGVNPDQGVVRPARVGDGERHRRGDQRPRGQLVDATTGDAALRCRERRLTQSLVRDGRARRRIGARDRGAVGSGEHSVLVGVRPLRALGAHQPVLVTALQCVHREERHDRPGPRDPRGREELGSRDPVREMPPLVVHDLDPHARDAAAGGDDGDRVDDRKRMQPVRVPSAREHETRGLGPRGGFDRQACAVSAERKGGGVGVRDEAAAGVDEQHGDGSVIGRPHHPGHRRRRDQRMDVCHRPRAVLHELRPVQLAFPLRPDCRVFRWSSIMPGPAAPSPGDRAAPSVTSPHLIAGRTTIRAAAGSRARPVGPARRLCGPAGDLLGGSADPVGSADPPTGSRHDDGRRWLCVVATVSMRRRGGQDCGVDPRQVRAGDRRDNWDERCRPGPRNAKLPDFDHAKSRVVHHASHNSVLEGSLQAVKHLM